MNFFCIFTTFLMSTCCKVAPGSTLYFLTSLNGIVRVTKQTTGKGKAFTGGKKTADNLHPITKLETCDGSPITKKQEVNYHRCTQWRNYNLLTVHMDRVTGHTAPHPERKPVTQGLPGEKCFHSCLETNISPTLLLYIVWISIMLQL